MNIIEQIHQYLTDTRANDSSLHGGEPEFLRVESPTMGTNSQVWHFLIIWDHHDGEIPVLHTCSQEFIAAGIELLKLLQEREIGPEEPMES